MVTVQQFADAKEDYQRTTTNLQSIDAILQCFENLNVTSANQSVINAIRAQAQSAATEVRDAGNKIKSYQSAIGAQASKSIHQDAFVRLKWSSVVKASTSRLAKVDRIVEDSIQKIQLILGLHHVYVRRTRLPDSGS